MKEEDEKEEQTQRLKEEKERLKEEKKEKQKLEEKIEKERLKEEKEKQRLEKLEKEKEKKLEKEKEEKLEKEKQKLEEKIEKERLKEEKLHQSHAFIVKFVGEKIANDYNSCGVSKSSLNNEFKDWFQINNGGYYAKAPKLGDLLDYINKRFGTKNVKTNKWYNFKIKEESDEDLDLDAEGIEHEDDDIENNIENRDKIEIDNC